MDITLTRTKQNGVFTADMASTNWIDFNDTRERMQLIQCNLPNFFTGYTCYYAEDTWAISNFMYQYDSTTDQWVLGNEVDSTSGLMIVQSSDQKIYLCDANTIHRVPNYDSNAFIITMIKSDINYSNVDSYAHIDDKSGSHVKGVPLTPFACYIRSSGHGGWWQYIVVANKSSNAGKISIFVMQDVLQSNTFDYISGSSVISSNTIKYANREIEDLTIRVSVLESDVASLKAKVKEHDRILKDLPAIVAAVSSDVSKLYVAR